MKKLYISDMHIGDNVFGELFAVKRYKKGSTRKNRPYLDIMISDKTGSMPGKIWPDDLSSCELVKEGDIVSITGSVDDFEGPQMRITNMTKVEKYNLEDFQPESKNDTEKMFSELVAMAEKVKNDDLKKLLAKFFNDKETVEKFKRVPAAIMVHHNYGGGLLEHSLEVLRFLAAAKESYPSLNNDLLITGAIFHDIGKIYEYGLTTTVLVTTEGKLLGHIFMGTELVKSYGIQSKIDQTLLQEVLHLILSHHGQLEWGSPVLPKTPEAIALHMADNTSTRLNVAKNLIEQTSPEDSFTQYHRVLGTELYMSVFGNDDNV